MAGVYKTGINKRICTIGMVIVLCVACFGWLRLLIITTSYDACSRYVPVEVFQGFSNYVDHNYEWYTQHCFIGMTEKLSIYSLDNYISLWKNSKNPECRSMYRQFSNIYDVTKLSGQLVVPETFKSKVLKWLGNDDELFQQTKLQFITTIFNRYTHESSIFNPLRSRRPVTIPDEDPDEYIEGLSSKSQENCDLCQYKHKTAEDTFGRIESEHSATAANAFKYDGYHALILLKTHHPLLFSEEQFMDFMNTAIKWWFQICDLAQQNERKVAGADFELWPEIVDLTRGGRKFMKVNSLNKQNRYPHLMWDTLPKGGASQVHPHAHATLNPFRYQGLMEHIKLSAIKYGQENNGDNYFSHLLQVHTALGLTTTLGNASAIAYLTPKKDHEVMILSKTPNSDFFRLVYYTLRAFIDDLHLYAWSLGMFLPELESWSTPDSEKIPAIARIITRGPPTGTVSDISALELFAASNVNIDPFSVIQHIENSVKSRSQQQQLHHLSREQNLQQQQLQQKRHMKGRRGGVDTEISKKDSIVKKELMDDVLKAKRTMEGRRGSLMEKLNKTAL